MKITEKSKIAVAGFAVLAMSVVALPAFAAGTCPDGTTTWNNTVAECYTASEGGDLMATVKNLIQWGIVIIGFVAVVVMIIGGVNYMLSGGDAGKVKKAKDTIMYGIIGLVIAILAYAIVNFILQMF